MKHSLKKNASAKQITAQILNKRGLKNFPEKKRDMGRMKKLKLKKVKLNRFRWWDFGLV